MNTYEKRPQSITDLPVTSDSEAAAVATAMLAKYKDPMTRITAITLSTAVPDVAEAIFRLDIGDKIRVLRTLPGGGGKAGPKPVDSEDRHQRVEDGTPWKVRLGLSPV